jgi:glutamate synthase domain-containing protein 2
MNDPALTALGWLVYTFWTIVGLLVLAVIVMFVADITQTKDAIRRNYPVIGRFRHLFIRLGEFFRQYFFAMDREELPFNRAQRVWVYKAADNADNTRAFGSTRSLSEPGSIIFLNCAFPTQDEEAVKPAALVIGPYAAQPFTAPRLFNISGMSFGALSAPAVRALSKGAALAGCWMNTGEGGLSPYHLEGGCDLVFQIGTAKYGVRDCDGHLCDDKLKEVASHEQVRMFEIKLSQGAKPGKGGILPAIKVTPEIARIRGIPAGKDSISPNRHPEIRTSSDLLDMIHRVRSVTGKPVGFKACLGAYGWLEELFDEVERRGIESAPDFITIDSADGGTGAAPQSLMDFVGLPLKESLPIASDMLYRRGLKERVRLVASGKLVNPSMVAWAIAMGADFVVSARGFMFSLGCIQALKCNKNTCPTGITTHDPELQKGLVVEDKATKVAHYQMNMEKEVGIIAHSCGVAEPRHLRRYHVHMINDYGLSVPLNQLYPETPEEIAEAECIRRQTKGERTVGPLQ